MKKILLLGAIALFGMMSASAQKYALIDMEYILKNIPLFELLIASENMITDNTGLHLMNKDDKASFNLESKEWTLIGIE